MWYGSRQEARGYDLRTREFIMFHFNYEHEDKVTLGGAPSSQWSNVDAPLTHSCAIWWAPTDRACAGEEEQRGDARPVESVEAGVELLSL
jgi:hypothetical protein